MSAAVDTRTTHTMSDVLDTPRKKDKKEKKRKRQSTTTVAEPEAQVASSPVLTRTKKPRTESPTNDTATSTLPDTTIVSSTTLANTFSLLTAHLYLPISPLYSTQPFLSLESDHLDPLILTYYPPFRGVILAYKNIHFLESGARISADSPFAYTWVRVDFLVWTPRRGDLLEGWVNLASQSHVGVLVLNTFNAAIPLKGIPSGWAWSEEVRPVKIAGEEKQKKVKKVKKAVEDGEEPAEGEEEVKEDDNAEEEEEEGEEELGGWLDAQGRHVDGLVRFRVESVRADGHIITIEGSMVDVEQPEQATVPMDEEERITAELAIRPSRTPPEPIAKEEEEEEEEKTGEVLPVAEEGDGHKKHKEKKEKKHKKDKKAKESS